MYCGKPGLSCKETPVLSRPHFKFRLIKEFESQLYKANEYKVTVLPGTLVTPDFYGLLLIAYCYLVGR